MTLEDLKTVLDGTGIPVTYRCWTQNPEKGLPPPLPWICYLETRPNNFSADGVVYAAARGVQVELYTAEKDLASETAVEAALTAAGIFYQKEEIWLESEQAYEILYEIEV